VEGLAHALGPERPEGGKTVKDVIDEYDIFTRPAIRVGGNPREGSQGA
jgi:hypothetical protein